MTRKAPSAKRSLLFSLTSLIICVAMLLGTTFAWFSETIASDVNIIKAGNLDVELKYAKVEDGVLSDWDTVEGKTEIFDPNALWEPGRVEIVYLEVSNLGTLDLKYQLGINVYEEIAGINMDNEEFELSDHLVFAVLDVENDDGSMTVYTDREAVAAAAGSEKGLKDYNSGTTTLASTEKDYVAVIVYMPETVGNEANYRGDAIPTINFGVSIVATQVEAEEDSFGPDYDDGAYLPIVNTEEELVSALENGESVKLGNDITLSAPIVIPAAAATYAREAAKPVVIDLNRKTLNTAFVEGSTTNHAYAFENHGDVIITGNGTINARGIFNYGSLTIESGTINAIDHNGGYGVRNYAGATFTINGGVLAAINENGDPAVAGNYDATALGIDSGAVAVINGGTISSVSNFTYAITTSGTLTVNGGLVSGRGGIGINGGVTEINGGNVENSLENDATGHAVYIDGGEVVINNGNFIATNDQNDGNSVVYVAAGAKATINGGTFTTNEFTKAPYGPNGNTLVIKGGTFDKEPEAKYVADEYKIVSNGEVYEVILDTTTFATASNAAELQAALDNAANVNLIVLTGDIVGDVTVKQISDLVITIDGKGHNYNGIFVVDGNSATERTSGVALKNINFVAESVSADAFINLGESGDSSTRYTCNVTVDTCTFDGPGIVAIKSYTGGDKNLTITGCKTTERVHSLGQLMGIDGVLVENCEVKSTRGVSFNNSLNVVVKGCDFNVDKYALRFGIDTNNYVENYEVTDCTLFSECQGGDAVIVLRAGATNANLTITNTSIAGTLHMSGHENANVVIQ